MIKKQLSAILNKEVDRKGFLKYTAGAVMMVAGGATVLNSVERLGNDNSKAQKQAASNLPKNLSYGYSPYGR